MTEEEITLGANFTYALYDSKGRLKQRQRESRITIVLRRIKYKLREVFTA